METFWRKIAPTTQSDAGLPAARRYHSATICQTAGNSADILIFGGIGAVKTQPAFNDLWVVKASVGGAAAEDGDSSSQRRYNYHIEPVQVAGDIKPQGRYGHSAHVFGEDGRYLWVFGGCTRDGRSLNDCWVLDRQTGRWECINNADVGADTTNWPSPRYHHSSIAINENWILIFGGQAGMKSDDFRLDSWAFNTVTRRFTRMWLNQPTLAHRAGALLMPDTKFKNNDGLNKSSDWARVFLLGGYKGEGGFEYLNDCHLVTVRDGELECTPAEVHGTQPFTARAITGCTFGEYTFLFGGYDGQSPVSEFQRFSPADRRWTSIEMWMEMDEVSMAKAAHNNAQTRPSPRYGHAHVILSLGGGSGGSDGETTRPVMVVFGGSGSIYLRDLVEIELP